MFKTVSAALVAMLVFAGQASAADHVVEMLNRGSNGQPMQFEPAFLKIEPGDTVTFKSVQPGHNVISIDGMMPDGAKPFKSQVSKDFTITFERSGVYGYKCLPHYGMGMVGVIQVGDDTSNLEAAKGVRAPGRAGALFKELFGQVSG
ncbi:pseudoazurin [alpha proteobacterium BAL199]|nr:pseudoazurin [alpha proteobacterium BAL199]